jgi:ketosteroid isomerase-like protein
MTKAILTAVVLALGLTAKAQTLKADDQLTIQNQLALWNQLQDDGNVAQFMTLWTANATFVNPFGTFAGKENIQKFVEGYVSGFAKGKRHNATNIFISGNGNTATVVEDLVMYEVNEIPYIAATVRLNASLTKEAGAWKFKEVKLAIDPGFGKLQAKATEK